MFKFFWVRAASIWIAALYLLMGILLLLFPGVGSTAFLWLLAGGAGAYGISHLWRYLQDHKIGKQNAGDLFLTILSAAFAASVLIWPQVILSILPMALGLLLLFDGVGKLPLVTTALREHYPTMISLMLSSLVPIVLGILIIANPFATLQIAIMIFGGCLIFDGVGELITYFLERKRAAALK